MTSQNNNKLCRNFNHKQIKGNKSGQLFNTVSVGRKNFGTTFKLAQNPYVN